MLPTIRNAIGAAFVFLAALAAQSAAAEGPETQRIYLSGHGPADAVPWQ